MQKDRSIAFLKKTLEPGQASYLVIKSANEWVKKNPYDNIVFFFTDQSFPCIPCNIAKFHAMDMYTYDGTVIGCDLDTAGMLSQVSRPRRVWYMQDLYHLRRNTDLFEFDNIMNNDDILKICRSKDHREVLIKDYPTANVAKEIIEDFDIKKIKEILNFHKNK